jgi:hypothetical protein
MSTKESGIEKVQHSPSIFEQDLNDVFSPYYCSPTSYDLQALYTNGSGGSFMTYDEMSNSPSESLSDEILKIDYGPFGPAEESSDSLWPSYASSGSVWSLYESGVGKLTRASSTPLSDKTSSDSEWNVWAASLRQRESKDSQTASNRFMCRTCPESFSQLVELEEHAKIAKHKQFACRQCTACFSRHDALTRHREIHDSQKLYPCPQCERYQGTAAFRRRDHLRQHLWKKHRLHPNVEFPRHCPYECCGFSERFRVSDNFDGFGSRREYSKHMREVHGKETHDCDIDGCNRVGNKGFGRMSDLQRHKKVFHHMLR